MIFYVGGKVSHGRYSMERTEDRMICITITPADFEYDIQSLVQAFYPGEAFQVNKVTEQADKALHVMQTDKAIVFHFQDGTAEYEATAECNFLDRRETKNRLKKALYELLSKATGKELPWGNLTGIRPAKIPALMIAQGKSEKDIKKIMRETYLLSEEKLELSMEIAKREAEILAGIPYENGYSLYVGIPFCPTTCLYCSFTSYPIAMYEKLTDRYLDAVVREMEYLGGALKDKPLNTVYVGGGTPTTLSPKQLERLIQQLKVHFDFGGVAEFTVEAGRPDSITKEKLAVLKENGVDRISINPQTMNQETLDLIGRKHTVKQVVETFALARNAGFDNINMDLILGLPMEDADKVQHTFREIEKLSPDSLTVHSLALKRAARLNIQKEKYESMKMENNSKLMELSEVYARKMNMAPYYLYRQKNMAGNQENVGYSRIGCEGIYNILMMGDKQNIIAMGAGATTKMMTSDRLRATRIDNVKNVELYMERIDEMIARKRVYLESHHFYIDEA